MDKGGVSAIVATVLIILITVVAVTIIWVAIIPMINESANFEDANVRLEIVTHGGYTFYDEENDQLNVQVFRGVDEVNMSGLKIVVTVGGDGVTYPNNPSYPDDAYEAPGLNEKKTYVISGILEKPDSVKVVPLVSNAELNTVGETRRLYESSSSGGRSDSTRSAGGQDAFVLEDGAVDACKSDFIEGHTYYLTRDIAVSGGVCISIYVSNVVLNLNGYSVFAAGGGAAVIINGVDNVTLRNGGCFGGNGVVLALSTNVSLEDLVIDVEFIGIYLINAKGGDVTGNSITSDVKGIVFTADSLDNSVIDNTIISKETGIFFESVSINNYIADNTVCDFAQGVSVNCNSISVEGTSGDGNSFGTVQNCPASWPILDEHYTAC